MILVLEHNDEGAFGRLNRPTDIHVADAIETSAAVTSVPWVLFLGGPVGGAGPSAWRSAGGAPSVPGWVPLVADLGSVDLAAGPTSPPPHRFHVFVGHGG